MKASLFIPPVIQLRPPNGQSLKKMVQAWGFITAFVLSVHKVSMSPAFGGIEPSCGGWWLLPLFKEYRKISLPRKGSKKLIHSWRLSPSPAQFPFKPFSAVIVQNRNILSGFSLKVIFGDCCTRKKEKKNLCKLMQSIINFYPHYFLLALAYFCSFAFLPPHQIVYT